VIRLDDAQTAAVDAAVEAALSRLNRRAAAHDPRILALTESAARAASGGKRFRPALVVAAFTAFGGDPASCPALWDVAAAVELLHTAFVIHDDLIDGDVERRGAPNVAGEFRARARDSGVEAPGAALLGDTAAVLAGDLLLFEAARLIATTPVDAEVRTALLGLVDDALLVSAAGELADVENSLRSDMPDARALLATAHDKTAPYSFRAPLEAGALLAGATPAQRELLASTAAHLGLAFQLVDDLIGTFGSQAQAGRAPGADLRESKRTPLIALARESAAWPQVSSALDLAATGPVAVRRAQRELDASGARARMTALVDETLRRARRTAASPGLPAPAVHLLATIAVQIEERIP